MSASIYGLARLIRLLGFIAFLQDPRALADRGFYFTFFLFRAVTQTLACVRSDLILKI